MITVAMPMYNAKAIGWLALESLCRQKCPYPWELMIMQETEGGMPEEEIMAYSDRLKKGRVHRDPPYDAGPVDAAHPKVGYHGQVG